MELNRIKIEKTSFELIKIPLGEIQLNDDRIKRKWVVKINEFYLSKYLVTQELYLEIMGKSPSSFVGNKKPVESVTWVDAIQFCNQMSLEEGLNPCYTIIESGNEIEFDKNENGFRLPTEAEWQYACQANTNQIRYDELNEIAWYRDNSLNKTQDVGMKEPNKWGLYDMLGNVWEWCSDIYDEEVYGSYRIFRGGGWADEERSVMATNRRRSHPTLFKIDDLGFRIARNVK